MGVCVVGGMLVPRGVTVGGGQRGLGGCVTEAA